MTEPPDAGHYRITFAVILVSVLSWSLCQSLVIPVLPTLQRALHTSEDTVTWLVTSYLLTAAIANPIVGRLGDLIGRKKVLVATLLTLAVGSVLGALSTSIGMMIAGRAIQGIGAAVLPLSFGIIRDEAPPGKVAPGISLVAAMIAVGGGAGTVLGGPITKALDYHWLFWIPAIAVSIASVAAVLFVRESTTRVRGRVAVLPASLLSVWLIAVILAVSEGQLWGWTSARTLGALAVGIVFIGIWLRTELRVSQPLIDMHMMRLPAVWTTNVAALLFGAGMYSLIAFLPEFLQTSPSAGYGFGVSATVSGLYLMPQVATMFLCGMFSSHLAERIGSKWVLIVGALTSVIAYAILAFAHDQRWEILVASALSGIGLGFAFGAMSNVVVDAVPADQVGVASGMNANIRTVGGAIGAAVMAAIVTSGASTAGLPTDSGYRNGFAYLAVVAVVATIACALIPSDRGRAAGAADSAHTIPHAESGMVAGAALVDVE